MRDGRKGIAQKEQGNDLEFAIKINRGKLDSRNSSAPPDELLEIQARR